MLGEIINYKGQRENLHSKGTRCVLIHPQYSKNSALNYLDVFKIVGVKYFMPPLGLLTVAALLPQDWNFKLVDLNVEPLSEDIFEWADLVCTGGILSQQQGILSVIEMTHRHGRKVVVGGPDPTSQPELYKTADYLVIGEGENTVPTLIKDLENGRTNGIYRSAGLAEMTESLVPRYDLIRFSEYLLMGIQFSRGCPYQCEFCDVIELFGRGPRAKTVQQIIRELQCLYKLGYRGLIFFVDDNFPANKRLTDQLLAEIGTWTKSHNYPFYFAANASINLAGNEKLLRRMKEADFRYISLGIETPDNRVLKMAQKEHNMNLPIVEIIEKIHSYGIAVDASFIMGFDNETEQTAGMLRNCIQESGICMAMIGTLYALPNTELARRLKREGRLFRESTTISDINTEIDQMSSGLNFITERARTDILRDYMKTLKYIYDPLYYYRRLTRLSLQLAPDYKHRPSFTKGLKMARSFLIICVKVGLNRTTGALFWRMFFTILYRNPKAIEPAVTFAAMFIHLSKHSQFIVDLTNRKIEHIEQLGEDKYNEMMLSGKNQ